MANNPRVYYSRPRYQQDQRQFNPWILRLPILMVIGLALFVFLTIAALAGYQIRYQGKIHAGVSTVYGVNMEGMSQQEAMDALQQQTSYADQARFVLRYNDQSWELSAAQLGLRFEIEQTVQEAYEIGRGENIFDDLLEQWSAHQDGYLLSPIISYDRTYAEQTLRQIARDYVEEPVWDAKCTITVVYVAKNDETLPCETLDERTWDSQEVKTMRADASPSQTGRVVDVEATLQILDQEILRLSEYSIIDIVYRDEAPRLASTDEIANELNRALHPSGVTFFVPEEYNEDAGPWVAAPASIANMLKIDMIENSDRTLGYTLNLDNTQARDFLSRIAPELVTQPINARFIFDDDTKALEVLEPSVNGRALNVDATLPQFDAAVFSLQDRNVPLIFNEVIPPVHDQMKGEELGIVEQVASATTYYYNSTVARRTNIQVAASKFHGVVIPPQSEFSFNEWLGDVSLTEGYEQALIIVGGQTITGVGGGVCQVSTTVFQAAFFAGFPILERYPHGYRVAYYENGVGPGMDATVYSPIVDFRFMNDTDHHLLIETYVNFSNSTITFKFYSTDSGRRVSKEGPYVRNVRPAPAPIYRATPGVPRGAAYQVDYAVSGSDVYVYRTIRDKDGNIIVNREEFASFYIPWPSQYQVSPDDPRVNG